MIDEILTAEVKRLRKSVDAQNEKLDQMHQNMQKEFDAQKKLTVIFKGKGNCEGLILQGVLLKANEVDEHGEIYSEEAIAQAAKEFVEQQKVVQIKKDTGRK